MSKVPFKVDWSSRSELRGPGEVSLGDLLTKLRDRLAPEAQGISVSYVDNRAMKRLNATHRGLDKTTDVLSFPANPGPGEFPHLGDIVISLPVADKMAKKMGVSRRREVETLVIHGFLHLCGYDHETDQGEMMALQAELEQALLGEAPLPMMLKRGRKAGSRVKVLKDGSRVVVTGRAAQAVARKQAERKAAPAKPKAKAKAKAEALPKRGPGRPRKTETAPKPVVRRKRPAAPARRGVIA